ncbi:MAG: sigma-70 family RNA polymerase sigma factor [Myxococcales bacterium]|nr:sigma-70 family RNA polymerase sigma factor [Myxococcales bacterium]
MFRLLSRLQPAQASETDPRGRVLAQRERLLGCALQLLQDPQAAQEVVLQVLDQALQSPLLVPLASQETQGLERWLDRLVVNAVLARLRQQAPGRPGGPRAVPSPGSRPLLELLRRPPIPMSPPPLGVRGSLPAGRSRSEEVDGRLAAEAQQLERLSQALAELSPEMRLVVSAVLMQGRTLAEVADLIGCSEESCRFWLQHGRKQLRRALQRDLVELEPEPPMPSTLSPAEVPHDLRRGKKAAARA